MKPPILYYGGKITLADTIASLLPDHSHYVEPFGGSLAVLLAKPIVAHETVNDLDAELMTFWRVVRDRPGDLARACVLTPHARAEFDLARNAIEQGEEADELETARRVWTVLTQGRTGRLRRTGWRHYVDPAGSYVSMPDYLAGYVERLAPAAERLARVSLECRPAIEMIDRYGASEEVCLYVDPPYLGSTRGNDNAYRYEMRTEAQHVELAEALHACRAAVVLSGYPSPLYEAMYGDWYRRDFAASTGQGGTWANRIEVLWSNRELGRQPELFAPEESA